MRINLYLTPSEPLRALSSSSSSSAAASSSDPTASIPKPLLALSPDGELILVELQGSLEMELQHAGVAHSNGPASANGEVIGEFIWGDGKEDKPTLLLSHHRLEGKLVNLPKPLAVIQKRKRVLPAPMSKKQHSKQSSSSTAIDRIQAAEGAKVDADADVDADETLHAPSTPRAAEHLPDPLRSSPIPGSSPVRMRGGGGGVGLLGDSDDSEGSDADEGDGRASPSMQRKRARLDASVLKSSQKPSSADPGSSSAASSGARMDEDAEEHDRRDIPSSSTAPLPPMRGSALDFSSPPPSSSPMRSSPGEGASRHSATLKRNGDGDAHDIQEGEVARPNASGGQDDPFAVDLGDRKRPTATYYDVMCVVRKKVLFSKRPEPVVHAQGRGR